MDRITLIDGHHAIWRANVYFNKVKHEICSLEINECLEKHPRWRDNRIHCSCGSKQDSISDLCYGQKYTFAFNFFRNLRPLIEDGAPDKCFFVLEGHPQFRYDLYPDYKANRFVKQGSIKQETLDKFQETRYIILDCLQHLPITIVKAEKYEADDVIGTLCENMKEENLTVISGDSDYIQLLQRKYKNINIYNPIKKENMEAPTYPYIAWKCLAGDKSDNIAGLLRGKKILQTINNAELFKEFMAVEENRANFNINRQLIEFRSVPEEEILFQEGIKDYEQLRKKFETMDFQSIINEQSWNRYKNTFDVLKY